MLYLQHIHYLHHHHLHHYILYITHITYIFCTIFATSSSSSSSPSSSSSLSSPPPPPSSSSSSSISPTLSTSPTQSFPSASSTWHTSSTTHTWPTSSSISLHSLHHLHLQAYPTLHHLQHHPHHLQHRQHHLHQLQVINFKGKPYKTWKMSFTQELTCRWSTSTWTPTRLLPARSFAQKLLHRSCYTGVQLTFRGSNCMWTPAKSDFSSSSVSLWRQRQPGGGLRNVTLCGVSDTQTCGEMRVLFVLKLGQPSAEIVHVGWANMWCGEMRNFFARSNRLRRSCVSNAQTCGGMWSSFGHGQPSAEIAQVGHPNTWQNANLVGPGAAPSHEMRVNHQKLV